MKTPAQKRAQATYARKRYPISTAQGSKDEAMEFRDACRDDGITQLDALKLIILLAKKENLKSLFESMI